MNSNQKEVIIIAGANGSGKTTFAKKLLEAFKYEFLNADEIAKRINPNDLTKVRIKAGKEFLSRVSTVIENRKNFVLETTLSGKYIEKIIEMLKHKGYIISIFFIFLESPEDCLNRIKQRVLKGGHDVPDEDVIRRYYRGKINFWSKYRNTVNKWYLMDNSQGNFIEICLGTGETMIVNDEMVFKKFLKGLKG